MTDPSRRNVLTALAVTASGTMLPRTLFAQSTGHLIGGADVCAIQPEATEGPYYIDPGLIRRDITEDRDGVPLLLRMQVVDATCQPIAGARVDVWHCDAQGAYSAFQDDQGNSQKGTTFLRGTQMADENGIVEFETIYPGWYRGRTVHIHYKVFPDDFSEMTGQLYFDESVSDAIFAEVATYEKRGQRTLNGNDHIMQRAGDVAIAKTIREDLGLLAELVVGVAA